MKLHQQEYRGLQCGCALCECEARYSRLWRAVLWCSVCSVLLALVLAGCDDPSLILVHQSADAGGDVVNVAPADALVVDVARPWCTHDERCLTLITPTRAACLCPFAVDGAVFESGGANASPYCQRRSVTLYQCPGDAAVGAACCMEVER